MAKLGVTLMGGIVSMLVDAYLAAALWADLDESHKSLGLTIHEFSNGSKMRAERDCIAFVSENFTDIHDALHHPQVPYDWENVGHDLWLTRQGHGAGFWDRGLGDVGERLSEAARKMGERYLILGNDGMVYIEG